MDKPEQNDHCIDSSRRVYDKCIESVAMYDKLIWKICYKSYIEEIERCKSDKKKMINEN